MEQNLKNMNIDLWDTGENRVMASTTALAQGLHREHVRHVLFYQDTYGAISYAQAAGRAGRDGHFAYVTSIVGPNRNIPMIGRPASKRGCVPRSRKSYVEPGSDFLFSQSLRNMDLCRRYAITDFMDGKVLAVRCTDDIASLCNYCDVCNRQGNMAVQIRKWAAAPPPVQSINPLLSGHAVQIPRTPALATVASNGHFQKWTAPSASAANPLPPGFMIRAQKPAEAPVPINFSAQKAEHSRLSARTVIQPPTTIIPSNTGIPLQRAAMTAARPIVSTTRGAAPVVAHDTPAVLISAPPATTFSAVGHATTMRNQSTEQQSRAPAASPDDYDQFDDFVDLTAEDWSMLDDTVTSETLAVSNSN